jgi:hypothetical protein
VEIVAERKRQIEQVSEMNAWSFKIHFDYVSITYWKKKENKDDEVFIFFS